MPKDRKPFTQLKESRRIDVDWLPEDLRTFYESREGVGSDSTSDPDVRLCKLEQLSRIKWKDLHILGDREPRDGWKDFAAIRIGAGAYGDEIVVVISAPCAPKGSIMAFGPDVAGPGGTGAGRLRESLVLSEDFDHWITRLDQDGWVEYGLGPGGIKNLPAERQKELRANFLRLNPAISWGARGD